VVEVTVRLWLARHGATDWGEAGRFVGWRDVPLNGAGRFQARRLGESLAGANFNGRWSSDLLRATETARLAVGETACDARLRELDFGHLEGKTWDECPAGVREALQRFEGFRAPGGESVAELRSRALEFVDALSDGDHLLFTHGGVVRILLREVSRDRLVAPGEVIRVSWDG
jgi:probable phosphoglycerate mutase